MSNTNEAIKHRLQVACDVFQKSIEDSNICQLASSFNDDEPCSISGEPQVGGFNICYTVIFSSNKKWIVRIPFPANVAFVDEKLESEIAVMKFLADKTTIPVPRVHGYAFQKDNHPAGFAFMIVDFIGGTNLSNTFYLLPQLKRDHFYRELAKIYLQLRAHEFPHAGSLAISESAGGWTFDIPRRPLSIELNEQGVEYQDAENIVSKDAIFKSAEEYLTYQLDLISNSFKEGKNSVYNENDAGVRIYALHEFQKIAKEWLNVKWSDGPFVLDHRDLRPDNIRVDEDMNIVGVIDWEWAHVVPIQFFLPPMWLTGTTPTELCWYTNRVQYSKELQLLKNAIRALGEEGESLMKSWKGVGQDPGFLVAYALREPAFVQTLHCRYYEPRLYKGCPTLTNRAADFLESNPSCRELIQRKVSDRNLYVEELKELGLEERY